MNSLYCSTALTNFDMKSCEFVVLSSTHLTNMYIKTSANVELFNLVTKSTTFEIMSKHLRTAQLNEL